jgi:hypothetical protein
MLADPKGETAAALAAAKALAARRREELAALGPKQSLIQLLTAPGADRAPALKDSTPEAYRGQLQVTPAPGQRRLPFLSR